MSDKDAIKAVVEELYGDELDKLRRQIRVKNIEICEKDREIKKLDEKLKKLEKLENNKELIKKIQ